MTDFRSNNGIASADLKQFLKEGKPAFWIELAKRTASTSAFSEIISLSTLRKKAAKIGLNGNAAQVKPAKVAMIGGSTLYPLSEVLEHMLALTVGKVKLMTGEFNNFRAEILEQSSPVYDFEPDFLVIIPDERSCRYAGRLNDAADMVEAEVNGISSDILQLCSVVRERSSAEIILCNFMLPSVADPGPLRTKSPASDWNFRKAVNLAIGTRAPNYVHICDLEFLAYRSGGMAARDNKAWFESKQFCSPSLQIALAREVAHIVDAVRKTPKKVLVLDLDNTLWGGVIGDDGIEGIEIGDTSPRGEAFKAFQSYILSLTERGFILAVCSKNDIEIALEPFKRHPEMVLREEHFVSFKANWEPKAQNIIHIAKELNLGLESFIFVDDNPAEIENVRQFAPEVTCILLGDDPSGYVTQLQESRLFERELITGEDLRKTEQYQEEAARRKLEVSSADMDSYLDSLEMTGTFRSFNPIDLPRIAQLVNKSNQFNLTTRRRSEAELATIMSDKNSAGFSMRLADKFGDHGLISVVICSQESNDILEIDTWLMSCRVLKRQVEDEVLNEIVRLASTRGCTRVTGIYLSTEKNGMVRDLFERLGFDKVGSDDGRSKFELSVKDFRKRDTFICINGEEAF